MQLVNAISAGLFGDAYVPLDPQRPETGQTFAEVLRVSEGRRSRHSRPEEHVAAHVADILAEGGPVVDREGDPKSPEFRPVEPRDIALLCPTHAMAARYAGALKQQDVPVRISAPGWLDSPAVMAARNALGFAVDPTDRHAALALLTLGPTAMPLQQAMTALADGVLQACPELGPLREVAETGPAMPLETLLPQVLESAGILEWAATLPDAAQAHADLMRLRAEVTEFVDAHRDFKAAAGFHGAGAQVFLGWLEARRDERDFDRHPDPGQGEAQGVEIVTWHACKGREWPVTVVVGLDNKIGERPGTLRAEFTDFSDLGAILERARLIWTPDLPIREKRDIFVSDRREASEADARRLLYVILTRARDRLVLEWPDFALRKLREGEGPSSHAEMLVLEAGLEPEEGCLKAGEASFAARILNCPGDAPELPDVMQAGEGQARLAFGELRDLPAGERSPWRIRPSQIAPDATRAHATRLVRLGVPAQPVALAGPAGERGTALHKAMRVFLARPDLRPRLGLATAGLDEPTLDVLEARAQALRAWLKSEGYARIECEVPVQRREDSGAELNGVVDVLAEGHGKWLILDHKSGAGEFGDYAAQLEAYRESLARQGGFGRPGIALHWIDRAAVEISIEDRTK